MTDDEKARLRQRAYQLWEAAGKPDVDPLAFWSLAVQEMRLKDNASERAAPKTEGRDGDLAS